jgi:hypothetical protein
MPLPESFIQHLRDYGYHPRSNKHSNAFAAAVVQDLVRSCERIAREAGEGRLVYDVNMDLRFGTSTWNVDFVLGTPPEPVDTAGSPIVQARPATVRIAVEIKGVMTEHRKAVKNRKRDLEAHHEHVHHYGRTTIAGGVMVINASPSFSSPLRQLRMAQRTPAIMSGLVLHSINEMRNVTEAGGGSTHGMEAKCVVVVDFDDQDPGAAHYVNVAPAPQPGDPLHYDSFIQKLCSEYTARFAR